MSGSVHEAAAQVLAEALEQAKRDAVAELRRELAAKLVDSARVLLEDQAPPLPVAGPVECGPATPPAPGPGRRRWYLYGITWERIARDLSGRDGIAGSVVEAVTVGPIAALGGWIEVDDFQWGTGGVDVDIDSLMPRLQEHERVLEGVIDVGPVLPARFGRVYPGVEEVEDSLRRDGGEMVGALRRLDGRAEWALTLEWDPAPSRVLAGEGPASGAGYLARRQTEIALSETAERSAREEAVRVHDSLSHVADGEVLHPVNGRRTGSLPVVLRASYLVANGDAERFRRAAADAVASAPGSLHMSGEITGPWPPYNFSELGGSAAIPA